MAILKNVSLKWACLDHPDKFGKYSVDALLNGDQVDQMESEGLKVKEKDGESYYSFRKPTATRMNKPLPPVSIYNANGTKFEGKIGNGTLADIEYHANPYNVNGNSGVSARIKAVKINELVEYTGGTSLEFDTDVESIY